VFVNLDKKTVSSSSFPKYPRQSQVVSKIESLISKEKAHISHPFGFPMIFKKHTSHKYCFSSTTTDLISKELAQPFAQLFTDFIYGFFVTDLSEDAGSEGVTVFNSELFLAQIAKPEFPFFKELVESQNFEQFIEGKICNYLAMKDPGHAVPLTSVISPDTRNARRRSRSKSPEGLASDGSDLRVQG
jgi:hypothetical protein